MQTDPYGFIRPVISQSDCVDCRLCEKTCPNNALAAKLEHIACHAGWSLDATDRQTSTSGGVASVLAQTVLKEEAWSMEQCLMVFKSFMKELTDLKMHTG